MSTHRVNQWLQLNVELVREHGSALASARSLFAQISRLVSDWRNFGRLQSYFFMRKPPDVRMRFLIRDRVLETMLELSQVMKMLQLQGAIGQFFFSDYPAELERFGGLEAMECIHEYFDLDTTNWWEFDCLSQKQLPTISSEILLPAVFDDLFSQTFLDCSSVCNAWLVLAAMTPLAPGSIVLQREFSSIDALSKDATFGIEVKQILASYHRANQKLARELIFLQQRNLLIGNLDLIIATVALFNFNRHGFGGDRSSLIVASINYQKNLNMSI